MKRLLIVALALGACHSSSSNTADQGFGDLAGADLLGVDLTGFQSHTDGGTSITPTTAATIIVEPSDNGDALVAAINGAQTSVHMTMYLLSDNDVINALIARTSAGKEVKVLLNKSFPSNAGSNASVYSQLSSAHVDVEWAPSTFQYTHEKCVILDGTSAWIMTMNATGSAPTQNREYLAVDTDGADVAEAEAIFQADWANTSITPSGKLIVAPTDADAKLVALIGLATTSVALEGEVLSSDDIAVALGKAKKRGCTVQVVLSDETPTSAQTQVVAELKAAGIPVHVLSDPTVHAKAVVVDGKMAYVGSENFTQNSLQSNRELGVVIGTQSEVDKVAMTVSADFDNGVAQ